MLFISSPEDKFHNNASDYYEIVDFAKGGRRIDVCYLHVSVNLQ